MTLWLREILGWCLLGVGLAVFLLVYQSLMAKRIIDCVPLTFIGYTIFRGGLHLIKVATAARIAKQATPGIAKAPALPMRTLSTKYIPTANVVPGEVRL
ncbi:hypothetical protein BH11PLA2_BH11PLA2_00940 [soil metagenome]